MAIRQRRQAGGSRRIADPSDAAVFRAGRRGARHAWHERVSSLPSRGGRGRRAVLEGVRFELSRSLGPWRPGCCRWLGHLRRRAVTLVALACPS
jgi:hypothetical protein